MAYTQSDLDSITTAILALASGTRKVKATIAGNTMEYGQVSLGALRVLKADIQADVNDAAGASNNYAYISTSKGL